MSGSLRSWIKAPNIESIANYSIRRCISVSLLNTLLLKLCDAFFPLTTIRHEVSA